MLEARIVGLGRAVPERRYTQEELYRHRPWEATALTDRLFLSSPVQSRALFVPPTFYAQPRTLVQTNDAWREGAIALASGAFVEGLQRAGTAPGDVGMIAVTTVTGYTTPGLDLLLARAHGLRRNVQRIHFNNIGCHAAVPLLRSVADHIVARPGTIGTAIAVEVCSACFAPRNDPENLVAVSLFADGAACAVLSTEGEGPRVVDFESTFALDHLDALGFDLGATGFSIVLDPAIPKLVADGIALSVDALLERHGLARTDVALWCLHPGGSRVLDAAQGALGLDDRQMRHSRRVLRNYGNMSSPSVLFVLAEAMRAEAPPPGAPIVLSAFGPGVGVESALLLA